MTIAYFNHPVILSNSLTTIYTASSKVIIKKISGSNVSGTIETVIFKLTQGATTVELFSIASFNPGDTFVWEGLEMENADILKAQTTHSSAVECFIYGATD